MKNYSINFNEDKKVWDEFACMSAQRSIFVQSKFLDSLLVKYNLVACYEKNKIVAGVVIIYSNSDKPIINAFPFTQYQGLLLAGSTKGATHSQITHDLKAVEHLIIELTRTYNFFSLCHSWKLRDLRAFQWHNFHEPKSGRFNIELRYTGILNLLQYKNFTDYLTSIRAVRRQEFKKTSELLTFKFNDNVDILDELHAKTFYRQNIIRSEEDSKLIRSISNSALAGGYGKIGFAYIEEQPVSAILFLYDDKTAYYLIGANDPVYRNSNASTFLLLQMIKDSFNLNLEEIDLVGVNSPFRSDFKISFNADIKPFFITALIE
jgi:hypothetical protein